MGPTPEDIAALAAKTWTEFTDRAFQHPERVGSPVPVFVPYTAIHPAVRRALDDQPTMSGLTAGWTGVRMTAEDSYPDYWQHRWEIGKGFVNLEHDVLPWPGALVEMWRCPEEWCTFAYGFGEHLGRSSYLGCVKFGASFIAKTPGLWDPTTWQATCPQPGFPFWHPGLRGPERTWQFCDVHLSNYVDSHPGLRFHQHFPAVTHLH